MPILLIDVDVFSRPLWLAVVLASLLGCSRPAPPQEPVRAVKVITLAAQSVQAPREFAAEVRARVESRLGFRVGGKLLARPVEVGQQVQPGQVLAQLDPQDFRLAVDAARAQLAQAQSNHDLAAADHRRFQALRAQNFISPAEWERRVSVYQAAQAQLAQSRAQLAALDNQSDYTRLRADTAGVVTAVWAERGQVLAAGTPVVQVAQQGARDVVFAVPEHRLADFRPGTEVQVRPWSESASLKAVVREVGASADPVTRTFSVRAGLIGAADLALGRSVTVELPPPLVAPVIKLPTSALRQDGQASAVWLLDPASMTVRSQTVQLSGVDGNEVLVASGLQPGQQVVVAGVHVLAPGQKVTLFNAVAPSR